MSFALPRRSPGRFAILLATVVSLCGCGGSRPEVAVREPLEGPWPVYEGALFGPGDAVPAPPIFETTLPREFGGVVLPSGRKLPRYGAYTVLVERDLPKTDDPLGIAVTRFWGASRVWCHVRKAGGGVEEVRYDLGTPGATAATTRNLQRWGIVALPRGDHLRCTLQFSNFLGSPGSTEVPVLGSLHALESERLIRTSFNVGLFAALLALTALHVVLYRIRRERSYLYFAQIGVSLASRAAVASRLFEYANPASQAVHTIWAFDVAPIAFAGAGAYAYLAEILGSHMPRRPRAALYRAGLALAAISFTRRWVGHGEWMVLANEAYLVVVIGFAVHAMARAYRAKDVDGIGYLVLGLGLAMLAAVYEILATRSIAPDIGAMALGVLAFMACQGMLLARRTQRMHDATERLARELERKNVELARLDEQKDAFVAATSHELKTPLHGMIGLMEGVRDQVAGAPRSSLDLAIASGRRLDTQISGLLDFAKLRRDELELEQRPIDTTVLVRTVVEASRAIVGAKALELRMDVPDGVASILGDEGRIRQILFHVVGNAVKFTERGRIDVRAESRGGRVRLVVADTGVGIAPESQARVFDAFTQEAHVDTRSAGGTGLGLAISRRLVELHGGTIAIASTIGEGTTVTIELPAAREVQAVRDATAVVAAPLPLEYASALAQPAGSDVSAVFDRRSMQIVLANGARDDRLTILAVDDDAVNQRVLETQLRPAGYRVVLAGDGVEALDAFRDRGPFDLVLLDVMMPRMSGLEALRELRKTASQAELPVILLTAKQQQQDVLAGFDAGANDYLTKPFSKKELLARIETHLTVAKTNQALRRFVPHEFLEALGRKNVTEVKLGDSVERRLAILFGDIRDFTSISEGLGPEETFRFVNECLRRVTPFVRESGGFVDKFIGDAVLALFPESTRAAVEAAVAIERSIDAIEPDAKRFRFGIGIHVGSTMMGTIGDERRFEATVISDAVNQAARIEGMTKHLRARVLVSGDVAAELGDAFELRPLGLVRAVGRDKPIAVLEVLDADPEPLREAKRAQRERFASGIAALGDADHARACDDLRAVVDAVPDDGVARFFLAAAEEGLAGVEVVRDGAVVLNRK